MSGRDFAGAVSFVKIFLRNPGQVGAIAPSSRTLALQMVQGLDVTPGDAILELGPGTGAITQLLQGVIPDKVSYLGIEREPHFVKLLDQRFPHLQFITGNAARASELCLEAGHSSAKAIISGLPFASLPPHIRESVIASLDHLMQPGSVFRTFQYVHAYLLPSAVRFRHQMSGHFGECQRSRAIFKNLPPAYILTWTRN